MLELSSSSGKAASTLNFSTISQAPHSYRLDLWAQISLCLTLQQCPLHLPVSPPGSFYQARLASSSSPSHRYQASGPISLYLNKDIEIGPPGFNVPQVSTISNCSWNTDVQIHHKTLSISRHLSQSSSDTYQNSIDG